MKLHPRHDLVTLASIDIKKAICDAAARHKDLTHAELTSILAEQVCAWNKYAIRDEREREANDTALG